ADLHLALDVLRDLAAQVALDLDVLVDVGAEASDLVIGEVAHTGIEVDVGGRADLLRGRPPDADDVGERGLDALLAGDVDAGDTSHQFTPAAACGVGSRRSRERSRAGGSRGTSRRSSSRLVGPSSRTCS